jgi:hypothetical protein
MINDTLMRLIQKTQLSSTPLFPIYVWGRANQRSVLQVFVALDQFGNLLAKLSRISP